MKAIVPGGHKRLERLTVGAAFDLNGLGAFPPTAFHLQHQSIDRFGSTKIDRQVAGQRFAFPIGVHIVVHRASGRNGVPRQIGSVLRQIALVKRRHLPLAQGDPVTIRRAADRVALRQRIGFGTIVHIVYIILIACVPIMGVIPLPLRQHRLVGQGIGNGFPLGGENHQKIVACGVRICAQLFDPHLRFSGIGFAVQRIERAVGSGHGVIGFGPTGLPRKRLPIGGVDRRIHRDRPFGFEKHLAALGAAGDNIIAAAQIFRQAGKAVVGGIFGLDLGADGVVIKRIHTVPDLQICLHPIPTGIPVGGGKGADVGGGRHLIQR